MALQSTTVNANHHQAAGLGSFPQTLRHGFSGVPGYLHLQVENLQLGTRVQSLQKRSTRRMQAYTYTSEMVQTSPDSSLQVQASPLDPQEGPSLLESLKDPASAVLNREQAERQFSPSEMQSVPSLMEDLKGPANVVVNGNPESFKDTVIKGKTVPLEQLQSSPSNIQGVPSVMEGIKEPANIVISGEQEPFKDAVLPSFEASSVDQSLDMESLRSNAETSMNSVVESSQEALNTAKDSVLNEQSKSIKEAYEAMLSGKTTSMDSDSSIDSISQASKSFSEGIMEAKSAVESTISKLQDSIQNSVDSASMALKSTYDNVNGSIVELFKHTTGSKPDSALQIVPNEVAVSSQESLLDVLTSPFRIGTPANNVLKGVVTTVESVTSTALVGVGSLVTKGYAASKEILPENLRVYVDGVESSLNYISGPVQSALQQVYIIITDAEKNVGIDPENPIIPVVVVFGGSVFLGVLYWRLRYGGYSGDLAPAAALDLIRKEGNIVLVDTRSEALRETEGIPDLRRQARSKMVHVEEVKLEGTMKNLLKNSRDLEVSILATLIKGLKNVQSNTKVIVMDADGNQSTKIARSLRKAGIKMPYRVDGGYKAWKASGLRVKQLGPETTFSILKEDTEAILEDVKPTPGGFVAVTLGVFAGCYALFEWEKTLQLLGLICIGQVLYSRFDSYESADDVKEDLRTILRPFALATQGITWIAGQFEPSKLQLATTPSTSAVQDRVLQAAAKHGPLPSELDQEPQEASASEETASAVSNVGSTQEQ